MSDSLFRLRFEIRGVERFAPIREGANTIGSKSDCDIVLSAPTVSGCHASIHLESGRMWLEDRGSRNGCFLDRDRVVDPTDIQPGALLRFGQVAATIAEMPRGDEVLAVELHPATERLEKEGDATRPTTISAAPFQVFVVEHLPRILRTATRDASAASDAELADAVGRALHETMPAVSVSILERGEGREMASGTKATDGVLFCSNASGGPEPSRATAFALTSPSSRFRFEVELATPQLTVSQKHLLRVAAECMDSLSCDAPVSQELVEIDTPSSLPAMPAPLTLDARMTRIYSDAARVALGDVGILILGESGTGKEVLARFIHRASNRRSGSFVALNCAALPQDLIESELFGIERGVATGVDRREGKFEEAQGGTLFLDELGDMPLETQAKILRVLQEKQVYRVGSSVPRAADVRVVAATNRPIDELIEAGDFREDLYYRLAAWRTLLPPLRERPADLPNLASHFLIEESRRRGVRIRGISKHALEVMLAYRWPGNVRELQLEMARASLFLEDGDVLESRHLAEAIRATPTAAGLKQKLEEVERREIEAAMAAAGGKVQKAAELLDLPVSTLYRRLKDLAIEASANE